MKQSSQYNSDKHHRKSIRLKGYDYAQEGFYFITFCCENRIHRFGELIDGELILNELGKIAYKEWLHTIQLRPNIELGEFIIMPNHFHAIIQIKYRSEWNMQKLKIDLEGSNLAESNASMKNLDSEMYDLGERKTSRGKKTEFKSPSQTIGAIVRGYKSAVTRKFNQLGYSGKLWERNYFERIIRNEKALINISNYIKSNPRRG